MKKISKKIRAGSDNNKLNIFQMTFRNEEQEDAYRMWKQSDLLIMSGVAGTGKTYCGMEFAVREVIADRAEKLVITRPVVEAGERLGFLPGSFEEKVYPYNLPIFNSLTKIVGKEGPLRDKVNQAIEIAPLAYLRGRTFDRTIMVLDEAQNATWEQLKMFVTRIGEGSRIIITGDPEQSDLPASRQCLSHFIDRVQGVKGVGIARFDASMVVRHPLISKLLNVL